MDVHSVTTVIFSLLILVTNVPLIYFLLQQASKTFLDKLIIIDCLLCILNIAMTSVIVIASYHIQDFKFCFTIFVSLYFIFCNRFLTLSIVICRYVFVLHSSLVETDRQRRTFEGVIYNTIFILPLLMTSGSFVYRDNFNLYLSMTLLSAKQTWKS